MSDHMENIRTRVSASDCVKVWVHQTGLTLEHTLLLYTGNCRSRIALSKLLKRSNMVFCALIFAEPQGSCWNSSRGPHQMSMYKKIMSERYYCIKTQCDTKNKLENLEETAPVTDLV